MKLKHPYTSRKLAFSFFTSLAILSCGCLAAYWPAFGTNLQTVIGGLVTALVAFLGGNVSDQWIMSKHGIPGAKDDEIKSEPPVEPIPPG